MSISKKIDRLHKKISQALDEIEHVRGNCPHGILSKRARSNVGNYCQADDEYWYEFSCQVCGKQWQENQGDYNDKMRKQNWQWEKERTIIDK